MSCTNATTPATTKASGRNSYSPRSSPADAMTGFAEQCMAEYDLDGWTAPDLINPGS
jgi:hypothetical protein